MKKSILYTATGDKGTTSLVDGTRTPKDDPRVEAYGTLDELNSHIGLLRSACPPDELDTDTTLNTIQCRLFDIGTALATPTPNDSADAPQALTTEDIRALENAIDTVDAAVEPMRGFILPAGSESAARAHVARTVCRRAERRIVSLSKHTAVHNLSLIYLNRLSDYLFALARHCNRIAGVNEVLWQKR